MLAVKISFSFFIAKDLKDIVSQSNLTVFSLLGQLVQWTNLFDLQYEAFKNALNVD